MKLLKNRMWPLPLLMKVLTTIMTPFLPCTQVPGIALFFNLASYLSTVREACCLSLNIVFPFFYKSFHSSLHPEVRRREC